MRRPIVALIVVGALLVVPSALAAPTWLTPAEIAVSGGTPAVGIGPAGDAVVAWTDGDRVLARTRAPGGAFGDAFALGSPGAGLPDVAVAADGTAVAAWAQGTAVSYALRPPGGAFGAAQLLTDSQGSGNPTDVRVAVNDRGDMVIAYNRGRALAAYRAAGGAFDAPAPLSDAASCGLRAAIGAGGHAAVAWAQCGGGTVQVARRAPGAGWGAVDSLAAGAAPAVAVDAAGATAVAYESNASVRAALAPPGAGFAAPVRVSAQDEIAATPSLAAGGGEMFVAYRIASGRLHAARRSGAGFGGPTPISPEGTDAAAALLAGAADGSFVAAWVRDAVVESARAPAGGAFAALAPASNSGTSAPDLAVDGDGNALAAFVREGAVSARTLDTAGPQLLNVDVRPAGFAAQSYGFAFDPVDAWSAIAATAFDFGDGTTAPGPRAEHTYGAQGNRTVTMSATDSVGNTASTTRPFAVAPALDRTPPVLSDVRLDAKRFRTSGKETAVLAAVRRGTRFRYTLSEPAQATIFFERVLLGRRRGKSCVRRNRRGRKCRVYEPAGLITRSHPLGGKVSVGFTGRIVGRNGPLKIVDVRLKPGRYRATLVAADAVRNVSRPAQVAFTVLR